MNEKKMKIKEEKEKRRRKEEKRGEKKNKTCIMNLCIQKGFFRRSVIKYLYAIKTAFTN